MAHGQAMSPETLIRRFKGRTAKIGVIGIGYVGLPLALTFADCGFPVTGFDVDEAKIVAVREGQSHISYITGDVIRVALDSGKLAVTSDFVGLTGMDAIILCVPTPLGAEREPDLQYVTATAETIAN
ncbi:MAG: NAD(P)-binding domain-containing protein, partial [Pseudomonadota bacterium]|nr:NAD(P)-binding domain-containing protein [Pseudomonadota bacterium]